MGYTPPPAAGEASARAAAATPLEPQTTADSTTDTPAGGDRSGVEIDYEAESDSAFGDEENSETTSLASSIYNHQFENGRTYHSYKQGRYIMPNDEMENERLDIHHHIALLQLDGELHIAPIGDKPDRILDLGTGTGVWAIEMGDKFPNATITGVDLSPSQPRWVPPNVQFEIDDVEEEWTYSKPFDFIHVRYLSGAIRDWQKLADQCFKHLKPGGWIELKDFDVQAYDSSGSRDISEPIIKQWHDDIIGACKDIGVEACPGLVLKDVATKAGFSRIQERILPVPVHSWPRDKKLKLIGRYYGVTLDEGAPAISMRLLTQVRGWTADEVHVLMAKVRKAMTKYQFYHKYHVVWGQKPLGVPTEAESSQS